MSFSELFNPSIPDVPPSHFMPWHVGVRAESPLFFSRMISDGAGLRQGFQPRIRGVRAPLAGMPLFSGDTGDLLLTCPEEIHYVLAWFNARRGMWGVFRHRNYMDFKCTHSPNAYCYDEDLTTQGVTYPFTGDGTNTVFGLLKAYQNPLESPKYKEIQAIEAMSFTPYLNGVPQLSDWSLDLNNGVLTFTVPPANGAIITHDCFFDLWVRFEMDSISIEIIEPDRTAKVASLRVMEVASVFAPLAELAPESPPPPSGAARRFATIPVASTSGPPGAPAIGTTGSPNGLTVEEGQIVFAFKMDSNAGLQGIYQEMGIADSLFLRSRLKFYWDSSNFYIDTVGATAQVVAYSGNVTDWHEVSLSISGGDLTAKIDNAAPTTIPYVEPLNSPVAQILGGFFVDDDSEALGYPNTTDSNMPGKIAYFRHTSDIRPYATYRCEELTGTEPNLLVFLPFDNFVYYDRMYTNNIANETIYIAYLNGAQPGGTYTCGGSGGSILPAPIANFTASTISGTSPLIVNFTDTSTQAPTSWFWIFGDGTDSTSQNPTKTYSDPGIYTVILVATNANGSNTLVRTDYIEVTTISSNQLILNGTNQYALLRNSTILYTRTTFRIKVGFKIPTGTTGRRAIYSENAAPGVIICLWYNGPGGNIGFYTNGAGGVDQFCMTSFTPDSVYHTMDVTYEPNTGGGFLVKLYIDGIFQTSSVFSGTVSFVPTNALLGRFDNGGGADYWNSSISYVQINNNAPSAATILAEKCLPPDASDPTLIAGWLFNEGSGTTAHGIGSSPSNAVLYGGVTWGSGYTCS